jgi:hypothetical protein
LLLSKDFTKMLVHEMYRKKLARENANGGGEEAGD